MEIETWLAFIAVSFALLAPPGPITLFAISCSLNFGRARALPVVFGAIVGDFLAMTTSLAGIGVLVAKMPMVASIVKIAGAIALVYLGIRSIVQAGSARIRKKGQKDESSRATFFAGFSLAVLHPSGFIFFTSFAPQFINHDHSFFPQASILVTSFLVIAGTTMLVWLLIADRARVLLHNNATLRRVQNSSGGILILFGLIAILFAFE